MFGRALMFILICLSAFFVSSPTFAQSQDYDVRPQAARLTSAEIIDNFSGVTHTGAYNFNQEGNPGNRYSEWHNADGRLLYREGTAIATGRWTSARDMMCYYYDNEAFTSGCFRVYKLGTCFYFYSANFVEKDDELDRDYWTARSVRKGNRATCEDMVS